MKTRIVYLLIALCCYLPAAAQPTMAESATQKIREYLQSEGFQPKLDQDGDVVFKIQGYRYYTHVEQMKDGSLLTYVFTVFSTDQPYPKILEACNTSNRQKNVVKYYVTQNDEGEVSYRITTETFCNTDNEFIAQIKDAVEILPRCVNEFLQTYED